MRLCGKEVNHPLAQVEWFRIVLDEAHMAKSAATAQSKACFELRAARRWACTVGRCRLTESKPLLKLPMVSALETLIS